MVWTDKIIIRCSRAALIKTIITITTTTMELVKFSEIVWGKWEQQWVDKKLLIQIHLLIVQLIWARHQTHLLKLTHFKQTIIIILVMNWLTLIRIIIIVLELVVASKDIVRSTSFRLVWVWLVIIIIRLITIMERACLLCR